MRGLRPRDMGSNPIGSILTILYLQLDFIEAMPADLPCASLCKRQSCSDTHTQRQSLPVLEDRDVNASKNILDSALNAVGQDMPEFTCAEPGPTTSRKGRRVPSLNREPPAAKEVAP